MPTSWAQSAAELKSWSTLGDAESASPLRCSERCRGREALLTPITQATLAPSRQSLEHEALTSLETSRRLGRERPGRSYISTARITEIVFNIIKIMRKEILAFQ